MKRFLIALSVVFFSAVAYAGTAEDCRDVLQRNFSAMGAEDIESLMGTISPSAPRDAIWMFKREAEFVFRDTDVHLSLYSYEFLGQRGNMAAARVTQVTHVGEGGESTPYRHESNLLPDSPSVTYVQIFKAERDGRWYLWTAEQEQAVPMPPDAEKPVFGCQNGQCNNNIRLLLE